MLNKLITTMKIRPIKDCTYCARAVRLFVASFHHQPMCSKMCSSDILTIWLQFEWRSSRPLVRGVMEIERVSDRQFDDRPMEQVYRSTVVARLTYAASAWCSLTKASDRQRINSVINCAWRQEYCLLDLPTFDEFCDAKDDNKLFHKAIQQSNHVLHTLLAPPSTASQCYNLR